jgi:hypothetical protein
MKQSKRLVDSTILQATRYGEGRHRERTKEQESMLKAEAVELGG